MGKAVIDRNYRHCRAAKGAFSSPHPQPPHARARWQAANDERRRLCLKALAFERFPSECPPAANEERRAVPC
jgi:hypothetical protein